MRTTAPIEVAKVAKAAREVRKDTQKAASEVRDLKSQVTEAKKEAEGLRETVSGIVENGLKANSEAAISLEKEVSSLTARLDDAQGEADAAVGAQVALSSSLERLEEELNDLTDRAAKSEEALLVVKENNVTLTENNTALRERQSQQAEAHKKELEDAREEAVVNREAKARWKKASLWLGGAAGVLLLLIGAHVWGKVSIPRGFG